jgi:transcriptional regulator with XRE-family HTH domain
MSHPEIEKIISELRVWCDKQRGRRVEIAKMLGVSRQLVNDWLQRNTDPLADPLFRIRDFLKEQQRRRKTK